MEKVLRAEHFGRSGRFPLTQEELAEFAGASRATVNRVLLEEQARGTLELQRGETRTSIRMSWHAGPASAPPERPAT